MAQRSDKGLGSVPKAGATRLQARKCTLKQNGEGGEEGEIGHKMGGTLEQHSTPKVGNKEIGRQRVAYTTTSHPQGGERGEKLSWSFGDR